MEQLKIKDKIVSLFQKYKFVLLILAVGLILMLLPEMQDDQTLQTPIQTQTASSENSETRLKTILSQIAGAGRIEVMLTEACGQETVYQMNTELSGDRSSNDTVIISSAERSEGGLVMQVNPPQYLGAVIVCDGADDPKVCLSIVEATSKATGLGADKISVLKMK